MSYFFFLQPSLSQWSCFTVMSLDIFRPTPSASKQIKEKQTWILLYWTVLDNTFRYGEIGAQKNYNSRTSWYSAEQTTCYTNPNQKCLQYHTSLALCNPSLSSLRPKVPRNLPIQPLLCSSSSGTSISSLPIPKQTLPQIIIPNKLPTFLPFR